MENIQMRGNHNKQTWTSWSSLRADKLTITGNRPTNSGMRPYAVRSPLSTCNAKNILKTALQVMLK